jgi:hypothetical protein
MNIDAAIVAIAMPDTACFVLEPPDHRIAKNQSNAMICLKHRGRQPVHAVSAHIVILFP